MTATATNRCRRHRPSSLLAAITIDDNDNIRHDNIDQRNEDVDDDECRITLTMTNDEGEQDAMASPRVACRHQRRQRWASASNRSSRRCLMASVVVGMTMIDIDVVDVPMHQT
jgi:hypothetical protein